MEPIAISIQSVKKQSSFFWKLIKLLWSNCKPGKKPKLKGKRSINERSSQEGHGGAVALVEESDDTDN